MWGGRLRSRLFIKQLMQGRDTFSVKAPQLLTLTNIFAVLWESRQTLGKSRIPRHTWRDVPGKRGVAPCRVHPQ
jgi:hypothetical protein